MSGQLSIFSECQTSERKRGEEEVERKEACDKKNMEENLRRARKFIARTKDCMFTPSGIKGVADEQIRYGYGRLHFVSNRWQVEHVRSKMTTEDTEMIQTNPADELKQKALDRYKETLLKHREQEARVREMRKNLRELNKTYDKTEDDLKALQSVGQIIGELLRQLDDERYIVKASSGPRYVVGCRNKVSRDQLKPGTRVTLDMTTLTIMRILPREVDPLVYHMAAEDPGKVSYSDIGGLGDQIRQIREVIELPLINPDLFVRVGIKPPKGVLLYGPPGTGKTLLARAIACNIEASFLKVVSSAIVDKVYQETFLLFKLSMLQYIGESARLIREMFGYAKERQPCVIFMDEIDAIGGRRFSEGTSADREIQRTLMELLNQLDGFDVLNKVKIIMATNRPDVLDPALLRPGRLDRKVCPKKSSQSRTLLIVTIRLRFLFPTNKEDLKSSRFTLHRSRNMVNAQEGMAACTESLSGDIDYEAVCKLADGFNAADLRNVCTEAGMFAIRAERDYTIEEDFMKAVRKMADSKKLEGTLDYKSV
eukprot:753476-Hanusia_phi.AAC.4